MAGQPTNDAAWVDQLFAAQADDAADRLAQAKAEQHAAGKEPFDLDRFETLYDTTNAMGSLPARAVREREYAHRYYLRHPELRTLEELAALMAELDQWR